MPTIIPDTGARYFSKMFGSNHAAPAFQYVWDSGVVWINEAGKLQTGAARPVVPSDLGTTSNLSVSGLSLTVGSVAVTGNPLFTVSNPLLATSGAIQGGNSLPVYVTGTINTVVTGQVSSNVSIAAVAITGNPGVTVTGFNSGISVNINAPAGLIGIDTGIRAVNVVAGALTVSSVAITGFASNISPLPITGTIQGGNTNPIYVTGLINTVVTGQVSSNVSISAIAVTGNPGFTVTGWNTGISVNVAAPAGFIGIDTGIRAVNVVAGALTVSSVAITGNPVVTITGVLATTASVVVGNVAITGFNSTIPPLAVSGTFNASVTNPLGVTGATRDTALPAINGFATQFLAIGGKAVNATGAGSITGYNSTGDMAMLNINRSNGGLFVNQGALDYTQDTVTISGWSAGITVSTNVTNTAPINVTGIINTVVTGTLGGSVTVSSVAITGNGAFDPVVRGLLTGISGLLASNLTEAANVTGLVSANITGFNTGVIVYTQPVTKASVSNLAPSGVAPWTSMTSFQTGQIFAANPSRVMFFIQNIHTGTPLYVSLSSNAVSTGNFNFILNPSLSAGYGGSSFSDDHYRGAVTVSGSAWAAYEV